MISAWSASVVALRSRARRRTASASRVSASSEDDRASPVRASGDVGDRRRRRWPRGSSPGTLGQDHRAGAEAVVAVPLGRVDVHALRVGRHGRLVQRRPGARSAVVASRPGEPVARERQQAVAGVEELAPVGVGDREVDGARERTTAVGPQRPARGDAGQHAHHQQRQQQSVQPEKIGRSSIAP